MSNEIKSLINLRNERADYLENILVKALEKERAKSYKRTNFSIEVEEGIKFDAYSLNMKKRARRIDSLQVEIAGIKRELADLDKRIEWMDRENINNALPPRPPMKPATQEEIEDFLAEYFKINEGK